VSHNSKQDALPFGAEAATVRSVRPSHHSRSSQRTQVTNRTMVNVPVGIIDLTQNLTQNLFELVNAQRQDAIQREAAILHLANSNREDATQREQSIRGENAKIRNENATRERQIREENTKREQLAFQREKLQIEADLQRQLLVEASSKDRENHIMALQNRDELAQVEKQREREMAKAEADREMKLTQQLAVEKQRAAILQKENETRK